MGGEYPFNPRIFIMSPSLPDAWILIYDRWGFHSVTGLEEHAGLSGTCAAAAPGEKLGLSMSDEEHI